ncbi:MAG: bifunctional alpha,alpha-trehalose-phosphate synthase (UDP-forming)/trehalose-phosphatase [Myxococcota bacterium]
MPPKRESAAAEPPILVVSHRLPVTVSRGPRGFERRQSVGGLVTALDPVLRKRGGTWVGWAGMRLPPEEKLSAPGDPYQIRPVPLSDTEVNRYYHGVSNRTLWPLFHCLPERTRFERRDWETYDQVNARFAEAASQAADPEFVWIHDYQLLRAPLHLRRRVPSARIAFFLHIPFPPFDLFRIFPWYREVLNGLLAADLVGFHIEGYARNFLDCIERLLGVRVDWGTRRVQQGDRTVQIGHFPLGIDFDSFDERARSAPRSSRGGRERIVLGVDRLDYTKGIPERIRAFERLLELHPEHREKVTLLQLTVPSRGQVAEYQALKREIDELVGRVNGRFATATWSPIRYLYRSVPSDRLAAMYRDAEIALVSPLRDGMNLVAKEFVATQVDDPGVLIISRLAGAAETMHEALLVNAYNIDSVATAIHRALCMDEGERRSRMLALRRRERRQNVFVWVDAFLHAAGTVPKPLGPPSEADFDRWLGGFADRARLALFLDYDGTLTPLVEHPSRARLPRGSRTLLRTVAERDDVDLTIVSGRSLDEIRGLIRLEGLTYAGNHGLEISGPNLPDFHHEDLPQFETRTVTLATALEKVAIGGAWVEQKGATLTFHYRSVEEAAQERIAEEARARIREAGFDARDAHCAVEARPPIAWDKGQAVLHVLRARYGEEWAESIKVIYVGDDQTDEDAFRVLSGLGVTFRVGSSDTPTAATRAFSDVASVNALLRWLGGRS